MVLNTEAHAFPRFEMGKLFKTGWERKPRDKDGKILPDPPKAAKLEEKSAPGAGETTVNAEGKTVVHRMVTKTVQKERTTLAEMVTPTDAVGGGEAQVTGMPVVGEKVEGQVVVEGTRVAGS